MADSSTGLGGLGGAHDTRDELRIADDDLVGALEDRDVAACGVANVEDHGTGTEGGELLGLQHGLGVWCRRRGGGCDQRGHRDGDGRDTGGAAADRVGTSQA